MENRKVTRDMVLKGEGLGYFTNSISLEAKSPEDKEFETTFVMSKDINFHYKEIKEYIKVTILTWLIRKILNGYK